jgi:hypothetical protein
MMLRRAVAHCLTIAAVLFAALASPAARAEAMGIALEGFPEANGKKIALQRS